METPGDLPGDQTPASGPAPAERSRTLIVVAVAVVVALVIGGLIAWRLTRSDEPPASTTTSSSSTSESTTTTAKQLSGEVEVATVKESLDKIQVRSAPPEGWDDMPVMLTIEPPPPEPPFSQAANADVTPIPTEDDPVVGRRATAEGWEFDNPGPYLPRQPFTMVVTERRGEWAKVQIPVRPNGTEGWVSVDQVDLSTNAHRIEVRLGERMLRAYNGAGLIAETRVVVGVEFTPTPTGAFYITDIVPQDSPSFAPFALAANAYSEHLDEFDTGVPVIALHGTNNPQFVGEARSNGCIRVPNDVIQKLAETIPQGTPVYIWP